MDTTNLIAYLPFDSSTTEDLLGNTWTAIGNPTIQDGKLYLDGSSYLLMQGGITLGGQDFTIRGWFNTGTTGNWSRIFSLHNATNSNATINLMRKEKGNQFACQFITTTAPYFSATLNALHHFELNYSHANSTARVFLDGALVSTATVTIPQTTFANFIIGRGNFTADDNFTGTISQFQIYDGVALHTENFTPPTADDYPNFSNFADIEREISNSLFIPPRAVQFSGKNGCYGELPLYTLAGRTTFSIEVEFSTLSTQGYQFNHQYETIIGRYTIFMRKSFVICVNGGKLCFTAIPAGVTVNTGKTINDGEKHRVTAISSNGAIDIYCDGELVNHTDDVNAEILSNLPLNIGWMNSGNVSYLQMNFYEARLWSKALAQEEIFADIAGDEDGLECWLMPAARNDLIPDISGHERHATLYGSPNVDVVDEFLFQYDADIKRTVYINADDSAGTFIYVDGGFYQTEIKKTFNLPPTYEIWLDFDVHFDGVNRWRAGNAGSNGVTGMSAELSGASSFLNCDELLNSIADVCIANQLQNVCLHMISGASEGVIEARVDGLPVFSFTGDVNHGEPFKDLFIQSDGAGTYFSALLVSTSSVPPVRYRTFDFDIEAKILNSKVPWTIQRQTVSGSGGGGGDEVAGDDVEIISVDFGHEPAILIKLPPSYDMWIDFDICVDGTTTWGAGNISDHGISGIVSTNNAANFFANSISQRSAANFLPAGEFVPILLHLHSGTSDGKVETWVNGVKVQTYTGDVNHGDDFSNIFLHRDSDAVIFSNLTFSSSQLDPRRYEPTIKFCIRHNGQNISLPFRYSATPITPAVAIRHDGKNWYNKLCEHTNSLASAVRIWHDSAEYALAKG